ncbi:response regulator [Pseudoduganella sp. FT55W]|uniref:Virulence sensor protein BvgS n=1 Tax=Duganella rivi TaxID=2666083 RepID=A0A7X4KBT7_9BURK|nr:ATP-binding protein [Duganella rivi]MYM66683.1 response regulator [Duganella rivi]
MPDSHRSRSLITATGAALLLTIASALGIALYQARDSEIAEWRDQLGSTALLLAEQTAHEMGAADLMLDGMLERIRLLGVHSDSELRARLSDEAEFQRLQDRKRVLPQIDVATIVAANGQVINFTRSHPAPAINLADRDYFQAHRASAELGLYVSKPVRNKGNGAWTFYLSRRINAPDGQFLGVVLVGVSSQQISDFYGKIRLSEGSAVTLYRRDFTVLARWPHQDDVMGQINRNGSSYEIIVRRGLESGTAIVATPRLSDNGRTVVRMGAARLIQNYPLVINVGVPEEVFLAQWRNFAIQLTAVGAVCSLAVLAACVIVLRAMRKRDGAVREQRALKAEADAANRAKSAFLAMMSHEIRTPLTAVIGFAEQLEHAGRAETSELGRIIVRNSQHLLSLINDILDMSKVESGKLVLESVLFSPEEALNAVSALMRTSAAQRGIAYQAAVHGACPAALLGDPTRWRQILLNLVSNAIKFTEYGEVEVAVWYDSEAQLLGCRVHDTGIGMSEDQVANLFTPFTQADSSVARRFGGTGLGLYLVRQLAQAMGGGIQVSSAKGQGTTMTVTIRADIAPAAALPMAAAPALEQGPVSGHVLVVEDGADNRLLISKLLERMGATVSCAGDGEQGVTEALAKLPDLVLMDIQMPILDGLSATRQLREAGYRRPIVALTANVLAEDQARYRNAGFDDCLAKPIERPAFEAVVARYLRREVALASFDDLPEFHSMVHAFRASLGQRVEQAALALERGDLYAAQMAAHSIKGSAATFGCPDSGAQAAALELACRHGDAAQAGAALARLRAASHREAGGTAELETAP